MKFKFKNILSYIFLSYLLILQSCSGNFESKSLGPKYSPPPPGGNTSLQITCDSFDGIFDQADDVCSKAKKLNARQCVILNEQVICQGSGPCSVCFTERYTPEPPVPPPPTPPTVPPPPDLPNLPPPPTGGNISCSGLEGRFSNGRQICEYATQVNNPACVNLNGVAICSGFGPCLGCVSDGWTPPPPPTNPPPKPPPPPPPPPPYPWPDPPKPPPGDAGPGYASNNREKVNEDLDFKYFVVGKLTPNSMESTSIEPLTLLVSRGRSDGVFIATNKPYLHHWKIYYTINPNYCYSPSHTSELPMGAILVNQSRTDFDKFKPFLHEDSPDSLPLCYLLVGRGVVEAASWGMRAPKVGVPIPPDPSDANQLIGLNASKDKENGIFVFMNPPFRTELTSLYVSPDIFPNVPSEEEKCPQVNESFDPGTGGFRYLRVQDRYFNGRSYLDTRASYGIDLCYFLVGQESGKVLGRAIGFRQLE